MPLPCTGDGIALLSTPFVRHSSLPVFGSYAIVNSAPPVTSAPGFDGFDRFDEVDGFDGSRTTTGVAQLLCTLRLWRHTSLPVALSNAAMKLFSPLSSSHCTMTRSPASTGEVA